MQVQIQILTIEDDAIVIKEDGITKATITSIDQYNRYVDRHQPSPWYSLKTSATMDAPEEHTKDPAVSNLARAIQSKDPTRESAAVLGVVFAGKKKRRAGTLVPAGDLGLGDIVRGAARGEDAQPYHAMTVVNKTKTQVVLFRPYTQISEFSHTGGVTPYIGFEQCSISRNSELFLLQVASDPK